MDLNHQPPAYQTGALTGLSYVKMNTSLGVRLGNRTQSICFANRLLDLENAAHGRIGWVRTNALPLMRGMIPPRLGGVAELLSGGASVRI